MPGLNSWKIEAVANDVAGRRALAAIASPTSANSRRCLRNTSPISVSVSAIAISGLVHPPKILSRPCRSASRTSPSSAAAPVRRGVDERVGRRGVEEDQARGALRVAAGVVRGQQPAVGVPGQHEGAFLSGLFQQGREFDGLGCGAPREGPRIAPPGAGTVEQDRARLVANRGVKVVECQPLRVPAGDPDDGRPAAGVSLGEDVHPIAADIDEPAGWSMLTGQAANLDHGHGRSDENNHREDPNEHSRRPGKAGPSRTPSGAGAPGDDQQHDADRGDSQTDDDTAPRVREQGIEGSQHATAKL